MVAQHTCPDALISCSIGAANTVLKERMSQLIRRNVSMQSLHVNNATRIPPWPTSNFILRRLAQGEKSIALLNARSIREGVVTKHCTLSFQT